MKRRAPEGGAWEDVSVDRRPICSTCTSVLRVRGRLCREDGPEVTLWTEAHGFVEVLAWYCPECDPNLAALGALRSPN